VITQAVWQNEGRHQAPVDASPAVVNFPKLRGVMESRMLKHTGSALIMRRGQTFAPLGAAPLEHQTAALRRHAGPEAVRLRTSAIVRLKCSFRHSEPLSPQTKRSRLTFGSVSVKVPSPLRNTPRRRRINFIPVSDSKPPSEVYQPRH
jgi:hypothetical protein